MRILYDDLYEFSQVAIRCEDTVRKNKCQYCPFYDRCDVADPESRHIQFGDIVKKDGAGNERVKTLSVLWER